jgi:hypothetical protein
MSPYGGILVLREIPGLVHELLGTRMTRCSTTEAMQHAMGLTLCAMSIFSS